MKERVRSETDGHSSRHFLPVWLLLFLASAWAQEAPRSPAAPATPPAAASEDEPAHPIDLFLGSAKELLPEDRWDTLVAAQPNESAPDEEDLPALGHEEDVQVKGSRPAPNVPGGIAGLFWALRHPTQAWRIFTPAPTD